MTLKEGDEITVDGQQFEVTSVVPNNDGYWIVQRNMPHGYYYSMFLSEEELTQGFMSGRIVRGSTMPVHPGKTQCSYHQWKKYVGAREVYDFCERCGAKRERDWRSIKDSKEY